MAITQEQIIQAGFGLKAAPVDDWRDYDERHPVPNYFDFDWLSARHPDLYHAFALSTVGLMEVLDRLVDLTGLEVIEGGAGTGRAATAAAMKAKSVTAVDAYEGAVAFGNERVRRAGPRNVSYLRADRSHLPFMDQCFDAYLCSWAEICRPEAYRMLRPGGYLIQMGAAPGALCGELTAVLADNYPELITEVAPVGVFDPACPAEDSALWDAAWEGLPVIPPVMRRDFTYIADYGDDREAAAMYGRLYGPAAKRYLLERRQACVSWRLRIEVGRVRK